MLLNQQGLSRKNSCWVQTVKVRAAMELLLLVLPLANMVLLLVLILKCLQFPLTVVMVVALILICP